MEMNGDCSPILFPIGVVLSLVLFTLFIKSVLSLVLFIKSGVMCHDIASPFQIA